MTGKLLTLESIRNKIDEINFTKKEKLEELLYCSKASKNGVLAVTNLRLIFASLSEDDEIKFEHILFSILHSVDIYEGDTYGYIVLNYAYTKVKVSFSNKNSILLVKKILSENIKDKVKKIEKVLEEEKKEEPSKNTINNYTDKQKKTNAISFEGTKPLNLPEIKVDSFKLKRSFFMLLNILTVFGLVMVVLHYFQVPTVKKGVSYALNFIKINQCENQMFIIGEDIVKKYRKEKLLPDEMKTFMRKNYSSTSKRDTARDPWGGYYKINEFGDNKFVITSYGPDRKKGTFDDLNRKFSLD